MARAGGSTLFVALEVAASEQERRLAHPGRADFGKIRSVELLQRLRRDFARCFAEMPEAVLTIDTTTIGPREAALQIRECMSA